MSALTDVYGPIWPPVTLAPHGCDDICLCDRCHTRIRPSQGSGPPATIDLHPLLVQHHTCAQERSRTGPQTRLSRILNQRRREQA